jgi:dynein heavy chain, axonemal
MKPSTANKKTIARRKLKNFDWTDDDIQAVSNTTGVKKALEITSRNDGSVFVDTMENKISRVQIRKKEAESRIARTIKSKAPTKTVSIGSIQQLLDSVPKEALVDIVKDGESTFIAYGLNMFFENLLKLQTGLLSGDEYLIPLSHYDSSDFIESNPLPVKAPYDAVCLIPSPNQWESAYNRSLGKWQACKVVKFEGEHVNILLSGQGSSTLVHSMQIFTKSQDLQKYVDRILAALKLRRDAVAGMRYYFMIQNMPFHELVVTTLANHRIDNIHRRALNMEKLLKVPAIVSSVEMDQVIKDYELVMNGILFNAYLLSRSAKKEYESIAIPPQIILGNKMKAVPYYAAVEVPAYSIREKINYMQHRSYLGAAAAIAALHGSVSENIAIQSYMILELIHTKTMPIEKFERNLAEQMITAVRVIKQEWPMRTSMKIREAILSYQQQANAGNVVHFDMSIRNIHDYEKADVSIRLFLERVYFMMSDVLSNIVKINHYEYTAIVKDLCSSEIQVLDIRNIIVQMPADSIYKRKVLPPLFSIAFRVQSDLQVLNTKEIRRREEEISQWNSSKEASAGEACPYPRIMPVVGKKIEYSSDLSQYKKAFLDGYDHITNEFADISHIRKFVMDKVYFPVAKEISAIAYDTSYIQTCRHEIEKSLDKALEPLTIYLSLFQKYEVFININNDEYIHDRVKVVRKENHSVASSVVHTPRGSVSGDIHAIAAAAAAPAPSQEIEIPVSVNLTELCQVLDEHLSQIQEIEESLPINPIYCGLFLVEVVSVRNLLLDKHRGIIRSILTYHSKYCIEICSYLEEQFQFITNQLNKRPENIEELVALEEYMTSLPLLMTTFHTCIDEMMAYYDILDKYKFKYDFISGNDLYNRKWIVYGQPVRIQQLSEDIFNANKLIRRRFLDDMHDEQHDFIREISDLEDDVRGLELYKDLAEVKMISESVQEVDNKLNAILSKAKLFNSRESLFEQEITDYERIAKLQKVFEPYSQLWLTTKDWLASSSKWTKGSFTEIDPDELERLVDQYYQSISKAVKCFQKNEMQAQLSIASLIKTQITAFQPQVPLIVLLRNPGMRERHWEKIGKDLRVDIMPIDSFTTDSILALGLYQQIDYISKISESAAKEYQIEQSLAKMTEEWDQMVLQIINYKDTGTGILKGVDEISAVLDEQITMVQTMMFSAFKGPFEQDIEEWNRKLNLISDVLEVWMNVQRNWLYLQPIFDSADINRQLPTEGKKFATVDKSWRQTLSTAKGDMKVIEFCNNEKLLDRFKDCELLLDQVQKGLSDYLETKRSVFSRFYFLSNDELLSILSESKDVKLVQPHLKKCFEGIDKVRFSDKDLSIDRMISPEGEEVMFKDIIYPAGKNVELWMLELEAMMRVSVKDILFRAISEYTTTPRVQWIQKWPGMIVLNGSQIHWTKEMEDLFMSQGRLGPEIMYQRQVAQLADMTILVRGQLSKQARTTIGALTVIDVHARDVIKKLVDDHVDSKDNFSWTSQLRYYWNISEHNLQAQMLASTRYYGYEYLGNTFRLVITPLTDKCYLTLMGALQMIFGGAINGPAGTGKTETTKDLAKALAMQCIVFNCSDGLDYLAMGKFFKGLASCGAWACFDEFNRINIEVLSVIGQQMMSIQMAIRRKESRINFEGSDIAVSDRFAVFITMNPGYAGRTALPDSLQALFRPVAMMVPDYALIGEIMFFAYGFEHARECGSKMVTTFKLCSEQLSSQPHYDYGMRAVKTVITAAGNLKRAEPDADEMVLLLRALQDVNIPKFLEMDIPLFEGIISDLFPGRKRPLLEYGALMNTMKDQIHSQNLQPAKFFVSKVIQLYEMIVVRHGLMLVGPTGGGKTSNIRILQKTLTSLKEQGVSGFAYEKVKIYQLNPKSITMGQMYGEYDPNTLEWKDGIMSTMYRAATVDTPDRKWILFDGPVDAIWIESMNTVLDDNKKLCLNSGEIIKMSNETTMMFEVEDLNVASPATVSRVGIIYMEPKGLGTDVLIQSWLQRLPKNLHLLIKSKLSYLFDVYLLSSISFLRANLTEMVTTVDNNLVESLLRILDCYLFLDSPSDLTATSTSLCIDALFIYALIWSVGITTNEDGRRKFDAYLRHEMFSNQFPWMIPEEGLVYDYLFDIYDKQWVKWMTIMNKPELDITKLQSFSELMIPTTDSIRNMYMLDLLMPMDKHILMVGATGTGKTCNITQYLTGNVTVHGNCLRSNVVPLTLTFSANTSANMTQDLIDSKTEKRRKGVYGPATGKKFYVYVDDLNMPKKEEYGAQPPIELLRQWFDQSGWYDRKDLSFRKLVDMTFVASMGQPGGGRQDITPRFLRHFNIIGYVELSTQSKQMIFGSILRTYLTASDAAASLLSLSDAIVNASINVFNRIVKELLPTPSKSHYTFNLRDLSKIFQGMLMFDQKKLSSKVDLLKLWIHENQRVFIDRLTNDDDRIFVNSMMRSTVISDFGVSWRDVVAKDEVSANLGLIYGDFMNKAVDASSRAYEEIGDTTRLKTVIEDYLNEHNADSKRPMNLVMFQDALEHVARIHRILRQPQGNALLLGVGGSGRQSMTRLASYIIGYQVVSVEIVKGYTYTNWREDIKKILLTAGIKDKPITFLFSDIQVVDERMVEDINNILNSGDVPNLYLPEDYEVISTTCRIECQKRKIALTKMNIFSQYIARVRKNIHVCIAMSPLGESFRNRLRNFPSLVNCSTIDWFTNWPAEALQSVGLSVIRNNQSNLGLYEEKTVEMFKLIHLSVEKESIDYQQTLRRYNYVTPTSYLELLSSFNKLLSLKRDEILTKRDRLQIGLDKLTETKHMVSIMQEELVVLQPQLVKTQEDVKNMMIEITKDRQSAAESKQQVEIEESHANAKAAESKMIADDAQRDLDEAIPALEEAVKCLNDLKKSDIDEVKALRTPPEGVLLTIKVCCLMFNIPPIKKNDPNNPGKKIEDYWEAGQKRLVYDAKIFLNNLMTFDKDNIPEKIIKSVAPYMDDPKFTPEAIEFSSKACTAICMWARAMYKYHHVALGVAPKRERLRVAEEELRIVMEQLATTKATLQQVNDRLAQLETSYNEAVEKLDMLQKKEITCRVQLANAEKLIGGLGGEEIRWRETVESLVQASENILGDVIIAAGTISYLGPFTANYRQNLVKQWQDAMVGLNMPHAVNSNIESTLANPVELRSWRICSLPSDSLSTQNALIMSNGRRWPLLIDPQGQANRYIRSMAKDISFAPNGIDIIKLTDKSFLRTLETAIQFGRWVLLENVGETLDAALEPILLQQIFKQGGQEMIKLGDNIIPYNNSFRFFMTTKLSNPHYSPEVQVKVSLLNFTITEFGLEEQLLNIVIAEELPEFASQKANLVIQNANMNKQLYDIESEILRLLSNSQGNILDDTILIETLASSKHTSEEIKLKMKESMILEDEINHQADIYRVVAKRASLLYFVLADLSLVDPMYQYSLQWFTGLFIRCISLALKSSDSQQRCKNLNTYFTLAIYQNICRSLFEKHKLLFSFILCVKLLQGEGDIHNTSTDANQNNLFRNDLYRFLLSGISLAAPEITASPKASEDSNRRSPRKSPKKSAIASAKAGNTNQKFFAESMPQSSWLEENVWTEICALGTLEPFRSMHFIKDFVHNLKGWQAVFDSNEPHHEEFPGVCKERVLSPLERLCILRCLRRDKMELAIQDFIVKYLGDEFIQPPLFDLKACYRDSSATIPLIFVLSSGSDPNKDLDILAEEYRMTNRLKRIALGQGQGKKAALLIERGMIAGDWIMLQNCHLSISWMPILEQICESFFDGTDTEKIHPDFRLWLTSMPSDAFPTSILENGVKITKEPPRGLKANLRSVYSKLDNEILSKTCSQKNKTKEYQKLLFGLSFYHAIVIERKKFGPLGWNIPYEFNDTDFDISSAQLELYISEFDSGIPYKVLQQLISVVNYGGRITDDKDMRTSDILIADYLSAKIHLPNYSFSDSGIYLSINPDVNNPHGSYMQYIDNLPLNAEPEVFGMHSNAAITTAITDIDSTFAVILTLQPRMISSKSIVFPLTSCCPYMYADLVCLMF